jgi:hypothetical protein
VGSAQQRRSLELAMELGRSERPFLPMTDLNSASPEEIAAAGISPTLARAIALWRPYRSWDELLLVSDIDEPVVECLQEVGFQIVPPDETTWSTPKPFKLSSRG